jgi:hypothetical protein
VEILLKRAVEQSLPNQQYGDLPSQQKVIVLVEATDFLLRDALKFQQPCKTANKAVTLLMQHEVQCICSEQNFL